MLTIEERIRAKYWRVTHHLNQYEFAELVGISRPMIIKVENNKSVGTKTEILIKEFLRKNENK